MLKKICCKPKDGGPIWCYATHVMGEEVGKLLEEAATAFPGDEMFVTNNDLSVAVRGACVFCEKHFSSGDLLMAFLKSHDERVPSWGPAVEITEFTAAVLRDKGDDGVRRAHAHCIPKGEKMYEGGHRGD